VEQAEKKRTPPQPNGETHTKPKAGYHTNKRSKRSVDSPVVQNTPEFAKQGAWSFSTKTCSKTLNVTKPQHHGPTEQAAPQTILSKPNQNTTKFLTQLPPRIRVFGKVRLHGATPLLCMLLIGNLSRTCVRFGMVKPLITFGFAKLPIGNL
jgi:hypothetical protein